MQLSLATPKRGSEAKKKNDGESLARPETSLSAWGSVVFQGAVTAEGLCVNGAARRSVCARDVRSAVPSWWRFLSVTCSGEIRARSVTEQERDFPGKFRRPENQGFALGTEERSFFFFFNFYLEYFLSCL